MTKIQTNFELLVWNILIQHRGKLMQNDEMYWRILPFINSIKEDHIAIQITESISHDPPHLG